MNENFLGHVERFDRINNKIIDKLILKINPDN